MGEFDDKLNSILSSPEAMGKIMELANSFSSGSGNCDGPSSKQSQKSASDFGGIDPKILSILSRIMSNSSGCSDDKSQLLNCMKPYLKPDRRDKIDKALQIAKMAHIAKTAFSEFSGGDFDL